MADRYNSTIELRADLEKVASLDIVSMMRHIGRNPERDFAGGKWPGINFSGLILRGFDFRNADLHGAQFSGAAVAGATFRGADISQSTLFLADGWREADLDDEQRKQLEERAVEALAGIVLAPETASVERKGLSAPEPNRFCRVLMVEDNPVKVDQIKAWLPEDIRLNVTSSAGRGIGTLKRARPETYAGIMLDHDLQQQVLVSAERALSGADLVKVVIAQIDRDVPILIHSANAARAPAMEQRLNSAGFSTTYIPFHLLTKEAFLEWIEEVREIWIDRT